MALKITKLMMGNTQNTSGTAQTSLRDTVLKIWNSFDGTSWRQWLSHPLARPEWVQVPVDFLDRQLQGFTFFFSSCHFYKRFRSSVPALVMGIKVSSDFLFVNLVIFFSGDVPPCVLCWLVIDIRHHLHVLKWQQPKPYGCLVFATTQ